MSQNFDWQEGNALRLHRNGKRYFPAMLKSIMEARHSILMEFYMAEPGIIIDQFIGQLVIAAERGVMVKVILDGYGAKQVLFQLTVLREAGISVHIYNPLSWHKGSLNFSRDHRKMLLVDQSEAFIGGAGLCDNFCNALQPGAFWVEQMVQVKGPVVQDMVSLFNGLWRRCTGQQLVPAAQESRKGPAKVRLTTSHGLYLQEIKRQFLHRVHHAQQRVWLVTPYFLPSRSLRHALKQAALRGVDVKVLIAGALTDHRWIYYTAKHHYGDLLAAGVAIYEYQPNFLHAKITLVDEWVSVGSCNLDHWNLRWNLDANIEVIDYQFAESISENVVQLMSDAKLIHFDNWSRRPWYFKVRERAFAWLTGRLLGIR